MIKRIVPDDAHDPQGVLSNISQERRTEFSEKKTFKYHRMVCLLSAHPQTKDLHAVGAQITYERRLKEANSPVNISRRQDPKSPT